MKSFEKSGTRQPKWWRHSLSVLAVFLLTNCHPGSLRPGPSLRPVLALPPRSETAVPGSALAEVLKDLDLATREARIYQEVVSGNIPNFLRDLATLEFQETLAGEEYTIKLFVMPDYLALGSEQDHLLMPMTPMLAQRIMIAIDGSLPTSRMVDLIWQNADLQMEPEPIPPSPEMVTVKVFQKHNQQVQNQRSLHWKTAPLGALVAGHKKDVILSKRIGEDPSKVIIYGWHRQDGRPIQPVYSGHVNWYADYSHGIRVIHSHCSVNGSFRLISEILSDSLLYSLLSDEAKPMYRTVYDTSASNYPRE